MHFNTNLHLISGATTFSIAAFSITTLSIIISKCDIQHIKHSEMVVINVVVLNVIHAEGRI